MEAIQIVTANNRLSIEQYTPEEYVKLAEEKQVPNYYRYTLEAVYPNTAIECIYAVIDLDSLEYIDAIGIKFADSYSVLSEEDVHGLDYESMVDWLLAHQRNE